MPVFNEDVVKARICPYCNNEPKYVDSVIVYGRSYGMIYYCEKCDAYVGVHKGTDKPLGRLANKELREAKKRAHSYFDQLWQRAMGEGRTKHEARRGAYKWLGEQLHTPAYYTHIGMFDVELCNKVVELCRPYCATSK